MRMVNHKINQNKRGQKWSAHAPEMRLQQLLQRFIHFSRRPAAQTGLGARHD